jgi:hypothetical protein
VDLLDLRFQFVPLAAWHEEGAARPRPKGARRVCRNFGKLASVDCDPAGDDFIGVHASSTTRVGPQREQVALYEAVRTGTAGDVIDATEAFERYWA